MANSFLKLDIFISFIEEAEGVVVKDESIVSLKSKRLQVKKILNKMNNQENSRSLEKENSATELDVSKANDEIEKTLFEMGLSNSENSEEIGKEILVENDVRPGCAFVSNQGSIGKSNF